MTKAELIAAVDNEAKRVFGSGATRTMIENILDCLGRVVLDSLINEGEVPLPGIGKLVLKHRPARTGHNPQTRKPIEIPARLGVSFRPGKSLLDALKP